MIEAPWNIILTVVFVSTGAICAIGLVSRLVRARRARIRPDDEALVDGNHLLMSAAMIWMTWSMESALALWLQAALFAALTLALLLLLYRARTRLHRSDLGSHLVLNAAMIWMLAAMPLLMADMHAAGVHAAADMGMHDAGEAAMAGTPMWVDAVNLAFVALSAGAALWLGFRALTAAGHRLHASCHAVMGAGMAAMLVLMN